MTQARRAGEAAERHHRLFFALWPDAAMRAALSAATSDLRILIADARFVPAENWHLTVAFLGNVPERALESLASIARDVTQRARIGAAVEVRLDQLEFWARAQLVCATARTVSASAQALAAALRDALVAAGFTPDLKPFRAHVTLARKVRSAPRALALSALTWRFGEVALVESRTGATGSLYSVVGSWVLDTA